MPAGQDERFSRQVLFAPIGETGQAAISKKAVAIVGCGALGTHLSETMVRAGVGSVTIIDRDFVEESNLQRQGLFTEADANQRLPKAIAAQRHLQAISSRTEVRAEVAHLDCENGEDWLEEVDLILDATDNFPTRFLINDIAVKHRIPWIYAACVGSTAMTMPVIPEQSACLHCLMEDFPLAHGETCDSAGTIMPAVLAAVAHASAAALQVLSDNLDQIPKQLQVVDVWTGTRQTIAAKTPNAGCSVCQRREFGYLSGRLAPRAVSLCGRNSVQVFPSTRGGLDLVQIESQLSKAYSVSRPNPHLLEIEDQDLRLTLFADGRALVSGTTDIGRAAAITARLLGV